VAAGERQRLVQRTERARGVRGEIGEAVGRTERFVVEDRGQRGREPGELAQPRRDRGAIPRRVREDREVGRERDPRAGEMNGELLAPGVEDEAVRIAARVTGSRAAA
jgi:hypothetical protein